MIISGVEVERALDAAKAQAVHKFLNGQDALGYMVEKYRELQMFR